jgi:hypothetical protein
MACKDIDTPSSLGEVGDEVSISGGNGESHLDDVVVDKVIDGLTSSWFELDRGISEVLDAVFVNFQDLNTSEVLVVQLVEDVDDASICADSCRQESVNE